MAQEKKLTCIACGALVLPEGAARHAIDCLGGLTCGSPEKLACGCVTVGVSIRDGNLPPAVLRLMCGRHAQAVAEALASWLWGYGEYGEHGPCS